MARVCLPQKERDSILTALKSGDLTIDSLYGLGSKERNALFEKYVGKDFADIVNSRFEQAMLSKQKNAMVNWVRAVGTAKDPIRRDMLKKVERIKRALTSTEEMGFLQDIAETKLGIAVTEEEAQTLLTMKKTVDELKDAIPENAPIASEERLAYGLAVDRFKNFVGEMKLNAETLTTAERLQGKNMMTNLIDLAGTAKSLISTLDNSFIGRQGIKTLLRGDYKIWLDTLKTSFKLFGQEMMAKAPRGLFKERDDAVMAALRADVYSRPNALNGKYKAAKNGYGLGQFHEEAFPVSLPSRIPFLGRIFKASETAFTGSALKMRVELADAMIAAAEKNGVDMLDERNATAIGSLVGSMTGRGELTTFAAAGRQINALMFAPRFLKANFNTLTAHTFDKTMTPYARRVAALSTIRIAASIGGIMAMSEILNPGSVDWDHRSTNFGKIKIGEKSYDITGGMSGLAVLASRITPSFHNGEWGFWTKDAKTGKYTKMSVGDFGEQTALDTFENFFEGKLSPAAGALRDIWRGQKMNGDKPSIVNTISGLTVPISLQVLQEELQKGNDDILFAMIAEGLGFSSTDATFRGTGKKWQSLEEKHGADDLNKALKAVTDRFNKRAEQLEQSSQWKKMTNKQQKEALEKIKEEETNRVLSSYGIK